MFEFDPSCIEEILFPGRKPHEVKVVVSRGELVAQFDLVGDGRVDLFWSDNWDRVQTRLLTDDDRQKITDAVGVEALSLTVERSLHSKQITWIN